ncbi:MAG TPA: SAM-dependent methyltransferase [Candidatus Limnocylindrales bacterium]|nr:SAM-dependent methyltransferase [Candidatus Limnocylindrales bacterium]
MSDSFEVGLRRVPGLDLAAPLPDSDARLVDRITAEIRDRGPMTFARFMEIALYDPEAGYYTSGSNGSTAGPGRERDFLTAPEGHPIFGWAIARHVEDIWARLDRPSRFVVREHGAGSGALAAGILDGLRRSGSALLGAIAYQPIEVAAPAMARLTARLDAAGLVGYLEPADDHPAEGVVLANELLDALPVHRIEGAAPDDPHGPVLERYVTLGPTGELDTVLGPPSTRAIEARLATEDVALEAGQPAEVCLALDAWVASAVAPLVHGELLLIDYGADAADLYAPTRGTTLRAYHRHRVHDDPLVAVGRQDLTAHVDLTAVRQAALAAGLVPLERTTQAAFLESLGLGELLVSLQSDPPTTLESYLEARSAVVRMLDPRATGAFAVRAFGRGLPPGTPLRGVVRPGA